MTDLPHHVADTHTLIWHLEKDPLLSSSARTILEAADEGQGWIHVSAISLVEMVYLADRGRIDSDLVRRAFDLLQVPNGSYVPEAVGVGVANTLQTVPRSAVPDMPDRIILATAHHLGLP